MGVWAEGPTSRSGGHEHMGEQPSGQERTDVSPSQGQQSLEGSRLLVFTTPSILFLPQASLLGPESQLMEVTDCTGSPVPWTLLYSFL